MIPIGTGLLIGALIQVLVLGIFEIATFKSEDECPQQK
jgi:mannose/fructose/N-acetylgalactosamine-specific phosphotransferase system component IIC